MIIDHHYHYPIIPDDANQSFFKSSSSSFLILVIIAASPADDSIFIILKEILVWYFCILCVSICDNPLKIHRIIAHQPPCCINDALYHWCIRFSGLPMAFCQPPITRVSLVIFSRYFCIMCVSLVNHWCIIQVSLVYHWCITVAPDSVDYRQFATQQFHTNPPKPFHVEQDDQDRCGNVRKTFKNISVELSLALVCWYKHHCLAFHSDQQSIVTKATLV